MANLKTPTPSSHVSTWVDKETFFNEEIVYQNLAEQDSDDGNSQKANRIIVMPLDESGEEHRGDIFLFNSFLNFFVFYNCASHLLPN